MELKKSKLAIILASTIGTAAVSAPTYAADTITDAFKEGTANISFNTRYEGVDHSGRPKDAAALTVKTSLTYKTAAVSGFSGLIQVDEVSAISDNYAVPGESSPYAVVADPEGTDVNQAFIKYTGEGYAVTYGRQMITNLNHRFLGHVGWRQNMQTFDGTRFQGTFGDFSVDYSYLTNVNTITGGNNDVDAHNLMGTYKVSPEHTVSGFFYQYESEGAADSLDTYGIDYAGKLAGVALHASYATQSQNSYDADYLALSAKYSVEGVTFGLGYELLGSDNGDYGFSTPLATKHAFNGFADLFLGTPDEGLEDLYASVGYKADGLSAALIYHKFSSDEGSIDFGNELNLVFSYKISANYSTLIKFADFSSDSAKPDVTKTWIQFTAKF